MHGKVDCQHADLLSLLDTKEKLRKYFLICGGWNVQKALKDIGVTTGCTEYKIKHLACERDFHMHEKTKINHVLNYSNPVQFLEKTKVKHLWYS